MLLAVTTALVNFHKHLVGNIGQPIGLPLVTAFAKMFKDIIEAIVDGD